MPDYFVASRAPHADVGGAAPGSLPIAREVYEEGFRIPPVFCGAGVMQDAVFALLLANVRTPDERRADLAAQLGAQDTARRLRELAAREGARAFTVATRALLDATERRARRFCAPAARHVDVRRRADDDELAWTRPASLSRSRSMARRHARLRLRAAGRAGQRRARGHEGRSLYGRATPGARRRRRGQRRLLRTVRVIAPEGRVVNPLPPAAVGAGNVETSQRIVDTVLGASRSRCRAASLAASAGTMNNLLLGGGTDPRTGRPFAHYDDRRRPRRRSVVERRERDADAYGRTRATRRPRRSSTRAPCASSRRASVAAAAGAGASAAATASCARFDARARATVIADRRARAPGSCGRRERQAR